MKKGGEVAGSFHCGNSREENPGGGTLFALLSRGGKEEKSKRITRFANKKGWGGGKFS